MDDEEHCLTCDAPIWPTGDCLCRRCRYIHTRFNLSFTWLRLRQQVRDGQRYNDFYGTIAHSEAQTMRLTSPVFPWPLHIHEVMERYGYWLDDTPGDSGASNVA